MKKKWKALLCSGLIAATAVIPEAVQASTYYSDTDTNADVLDYIENNRREERNVGFSEEQKQLLLDALEMRKNLRDPYDPTKHVPVAVEGDELFYDQRNGDFYAVGKVKIMSMEAQSFQSEEANGNLVKNEINVPGKGHMLQMTPEQAKIVLDGYKTQYNYGTKTGKMEDVNGKVDHQFVKATRIEFYPDKIVAYDGYMTRCSAIHPDYRTTASMIEIYPNDKMICHNIKFYLGSIPVYSAKKQTFKLNGRNSGDMMPRVGYNNNDGLWISKDFRHYLYDNLYLQTHVKYTTKHVFRNNASIVFEHPIGRFELMTGFYQGYNHTWLKKAPSFAYTRTFRIKELPFTYKFYYERGAWNQGNIHSMHTFYSFDVSHDTIDIGGNHRLDLSTSYSITRESANNSSIKGLGYAALIRRDVNDRWSYYARYSYSQINNKNSLFNMDLDDYSRKFAMGFSYRFDHSNRMVVGTGFDAGERTLKDIDLYWFHDMHCFQSIIRYRAKRHEVGFTLQFSPW
ncbi:LPS-assembly protein LptD [Anaerovibrio sp.]|uniref:LPS-assembly protein LptD n=1 Tax=Anaerovibrio sp. TaxID=1872532 RepID=UPI0025C3B437|nr:LPS-assembly protein LptD [Anaerovibrio sp.]MBR2143370.1 LPS-assembly protein LptD [Anaerovibrio sp.]